MNVFIILSILIIVIGVIIIVVTPSVLFKFNWNEKTGKEKTLMFIFYSVLLYIINIIYWFIKWVGTRYIGLSLWNQLTQQKLWCRIKVKWLTYINMGFGYCWFMFVRYIPVSNKLWMYEYMYSWLSKFFEIHYW